jgi:hypothetical protein
MGAAHAQRLGFRAAAERGISWTLRVGCLYSETGFLGISRIANREMCCLTEPDPR